MLRNGTRLLRSLAHSASCSAGPAFELTAPAASCTQWTGSSYHLSPPQLCMLSTSSDSTTSSVPATNAEPADPMTQMLELMMQNPATQQLLMSRLPEHMRKPEILRAMMANPEVRERIRSLAKSSGLDKVMSSMPEKLATGLETARQAGLDPSRMYAKLMGNQALAKHLQDPRVLAALMDCCSHGPEALKKYQGDQAVLDAYMEAAEMIQEAHQEQQAAQGAPSTSSSSSSSSSGSSSFPLPGAGEDLMAQQLQEKLGMRPEELMSRLMARPELIHKFQDPQVQAALADIAASPWKVVKYMFNSKVMSALKDMKELVQTGPPAK